MGIARVIEATEDKERIAWLSFDVAVELMAVKLEIKRRARAFPVGGVCALNQGSYVDTGERVIQNRN